MRKRTPAPESWAWREDLGLGVTKTDVTGDADRALPCDWTGTGFGGAGTGAHCRAQRWPQSSTKFGTRSSGPNRKGVSRGIYERPNRLRRFSKQTAQPSHSTPQKTARSASAIKAGIKQGCARRVTVRHGPQGGRGGSSWTSAQAWVSRWPTAWARCKGNVIDEPTAPQNLELGQRPSDKEPAHLVRADHLRNLLRLAEMIDLRG